MYNENYDELAKAIVEQAIKDYIFNTKKLLKLMDDNADMEIIEAQARIVKGQENFFRSQWYECLTNMDGEKLLKLIKQELGLMEKPLPKLAKKVEEVLAADVCPQDCVYYGQFSKTCDYCVLVGELRGCDLGKNCIRYRQGSRPRRNKLQSIGTIIHTTPDEREFYEFKREIVGKAIGKSHRRRVK